MDDITPFNTWEEQGAGEVVRKGVEKVEERSKGEGLEAVEVT